MIPRAGDVELIPVIQSNKSIKQKTPQIRGVFLLYEGIITSNNPKTLILVDEVSNLSFGCDEWYNVPSVLSNCPQRFNLFEVNKKEHIGSICWKLLLENIARDWFIFLMFALPTLDLH